MDTTFVLGQLNKHLTVELEFVLKFKFSSFIEIIYLWIMRYITT